MTLRRPSAAGLDDFEGFYAEHREKLFGFLVYRTGDRALSEDLLADVFERAWRARTRFDVRRGSATAWLYTIAVNRLRDHHRRAQVERTSLERVMSGAPTSRGAGAGRDRRPRSDHDRAREPQSNATGRSWPCALELISRPRRSPA